MSENDPDTLLTAAQLRILFGGVSSMTIWRWLDNAQLGFPKPIYISRRRFWRQSEVGAWQAAQRVERK